VGAGYEHQPVDKHMIFIFHVDTTSVSGLITVRQVYSVDAPVPWKLIRMTSIASTADLEDAMWTLSDQPDKIWAYNEFIPSSPTYSGIYDVLLARTGTYTTHKWLTLVDDTTAAYSTYGLREITTRPLENSLTRQWAGLYGSVDVLPCSSPTCFKPAWKTYWTEPGYANEAQEYTVTELSSFAEPFYSIDSVAMR
jgi:hypothetical protein